MGTPARSVAEARVDPEFPRPDEEPTPVLPMSRPGLPKLVQPSRTSCLPTAFCMVIGKESPAIAHHLLGHFLHALGRDDARGFHVQELLGLALGEGYAFIPFEVAPDLERAPCFACGCSGAACDSCNGTGFEALPPLFLPALEDLLRKHDGVMLGTVAGQSEHHAVAWCHVTQKILDPHGAVYDFDKFNLEVFWVAVRAS